jgi:hypothetical protein
MLGTALFLAAGGCAALAAPLGEPSRYPAPYDFSYSSISIEPGLLQMLDSIQSTAVVEQGFCLTGDLEDSALRVNGATRVEPDYADAETFRFRPCARPAIGFAHTHPSGRECNHSKGDLALFYRSPNMLVSVVVCGGGDYHGLLKGIGGMIR